MAHFSLSPRPPAALPPNPAGRRLRWLAPGDTDYVAVPASRLSPPTTGTGLAGSYFNNVSLTGTAVLSRISCVRLKLITRPGCERIVRYAFDYARLNGRKRVTCMIKDNIMKLTDGMFHLMKSQTFHALEYEGTTYDCGDKIGLLRANVAFALARPDLAEAARKAITGLL